MSYRETLESEHKEVFKAVKKAFRNAEAATPIMTNFFSEDDYREEVICVVRSVVNLSKTILESKRFENLNEVWWYKNTSLLIEFLADECLKENITDKHNFEDQMALVKDIVLVRAGIQHILWARNYEAFEEAINETLFNARLLVLDYKITGRKKPRKKADAVAITVTSNEEQVGQIA